MGVLEDLRPGPAALDRLRLFAALVKKWNPKINLVARSTLPELWSRHIEDSARLCLEPVGPVETWVDLGSGGGFPGLVIAALLQDQGAATRVVLVESDQRKAAFLREAARQMALQNVEIRMDRAESVPPLRAEVVSARALAALPALCDLAARHLAPGGICLFPKGERFADEVAEARAKWHFDLETRENPVHKGAALLVLRNLRRA